MVDSDGGAGNDGVDHDHDDGDGDHGGDGGDHYDGMHAWKTVCLKTTAT